MTEIFSPITATDALKAWDDKKTLRAFRVESDGMPQDDIYSQAFEMLRKWDPLRQPLHRDFPLMTKREFASAHSIAVVAMNRGWARMVAEHIHEVSPEITVSKSMAGAKG